MVHGSRDGTLRRMASGARDDVAAREHPRRGDGVGGAPLAEQVRRVADAVHVANGRETRLEVRPQIALAPQHARALARMLVNGRVWVGVRQVNVHVDETRHHGLAGDIDHVGIRRPGGRVGWQHGGDGVPLDDDGACTDTSTRSVEDAAASEHRPARLARCRLAGNAAGIVGCALGRRGE